MEDESSQARDEQDNITSANITEKTQFLEKECFHINLVSCIQHLKTCHMSHFVVKKKLIQIEIVQLEFHNLNLRCTAMLPLKTAPRSNQQQDQYSHFFSSIPSGGLPATFFEPTSFQFVDSTVPFDSTYKK